MKGVSFSHHWTCNRHMGKRSCTQTPQNTATFKSSEGKRRGHNKTEHDRKFDEIKKIDTKIN